MAAIVSSSQVISSAAYLFAQTLCFIIMYFSIPVIRETSASPGQAKQALPAQQSSQPTELYKFAKNFLKSSSAEGLSAARLRI